MIILVVNLFGQPGAGKSSGAAYIFSKLKMQGVNVELVTEFAKDKCWEDNNEALSNQAYIFGEQYYRLSRLEGKVDVVITDSPLLLSLIYNKNPILGNKFEECVGAVFSSYNNLNFLIERHKPYNPVGRIQSENESNALRTEIVFCLNYFDVEYDSVPGTQDGYDEIVEVVISYLKRDSQSAATTQVRIECRNCCYFDTTGFEYSNKSAKIGFEVGYCQMLKLGTQGTDYCSRSSPIGEVDADVH